MGVKIRRIDEITPGADIFARESSRLGLPNITSPGFRSFPVAFDLAWSLLLERR
jgi:hypothetical protein